MLDPLKDGNPQNIVCWWRCYLILKNIGYVFLQRINLVRPPIMKHPLSPSLSFHRYLFLVFHCNSHDWPYFSFPSVGFNRVCCPVADLSFTFALLAVVSVLCLCNSAHSSWLHFHAHSNLTPISPLILTSALILFVVINVICTTWCHCSIFRWCWFSTSSYLSSCLDLYITMHLRTST